MVCRVFLADLIEADVALPVVPPDGLNNVQLLPAASSGGRRTTAGLTLSGSGSRTFVPTTPLFVLPGGKPDDQKDMLLTVCVCVCCASVCACVVSNIPQTALPPV